MINLFVYGTLKRGQRYDAHLAGRRFLAEARTVPRYRLYLFASYPGLVEDRTNGIAVRGEIWAVDDEALRRIDAVEGAPVLFTRRPIELADFNERAWAYFYNGDVSSQPTCGDCWLP